MNNDDKKAFMAIIMPVGEVYNKKLSKTMLALYFAAVEPLSVQEMHSACNNHVQDSERGQYFPKPADLFYQHKKLKPQMLTEKEQAILAWPDVMTAITNYGKPNQPELDDRTAHSIKIIGGLSALSLKTYEELIWVKKDFIEAYEINCKSYPNLIEGNIHKSFQEFSKSVMIESLE